MAEEEDDYMSDAFLVECKSTPGLAWGKHAQKNQKEAKHKAFNDQHRTKFKPVKQREQENRLKGLGSALSTENKGFALLEKMGYKQGMGLGKKGSGRSEPIPLEIKTGRGGLGRETELKDQQERRQRQYKEALQRRSGMEVIDRRDFRQRMSNKFSDKEIAKDLYTSQKACQHLDMEQEIKEPREAWFWPETPCEGTEDEEEDEDKDEEQPGDDLTPNEKLECITAYLRRQHRYCIWCGTSFTDDDDIADNCPGDTADDHR